MWFTDGPETNPSAPDRPRCGRVGAFAAPRRVRRAVASTIRCKRGAYALEFALIATLLIFLIFAAFEMVWNGLTSVAVENALLQATRVASLGCRQADGNRSGPAGKNQILPVARTAGKGLLGGNSLDLNSTAYSTLARANDKIGGTPGTGLGGQIVQYSLIYNPPLRFSYVALKLGRSSYAHGGTITVKNEPFPDGGGGATACS